MDLEATVVERLRKLRQWQLEQEERLLKQQQVQRKMLTQRQDCIYRALELSIQELDLNEDHMISVNNSNEAIANEIEEQKKIHNESDMEESYAQISNNNELQFNQSSSIFEKVTSQQQFCRKKLLEDVVDTETHIKIQSKDKAVSQIKNEINIMVSSPEKKKQMKQFIIDGVAPLPPDKTVISHISIDDIPIPSPKKDFHALLEERLKDCENEHSKKSNINLKNKVKKPFLRKGEGLSRFKLNKQPQLTVLRTKPRSASFTSSAQSGFKYKNESKYNKSTRSSKNIQLSKSIHSTNVAQKHLCLKDIPLPKKKVRSKSESNTSQMEGNINEVKNTVELSTSDFHSGTQKELEEVRIFELLEEKAENSSFCSTSSAVVAFLQQSTPFKAKTAGYKRENGMLNVKQTTPIIKTPKDQLIFKSNQVYKCTTSNKNADIYCNITPVMNQKVIEDNVHKGTVNTSKNNITKGNDNRHTLFNQIQSIYNQQNFYNNPDTENDNEVDVSLHVRFSEYNEYKTIGLTDTSSISNESLAIKTFSDEKVWSDSSISETSTIETASMPFEVPQSPIIIKDKVDNNTHKPQFEQFNMQEVSNYETQSHKSTRQNNNSNCNVDIHEYICRKDESEFSDTTEQFLDDGKSILCNYSKNDSTLQKIDDSHSTEITNHIEKFDNKKVDECVNNYKDTAAIEEQENKENLQETNETIFKSELLKNRLLELEQEINIFRKENTALSIQRKKIQEDYRNLHKEYMEKEKKLEENKKLLEERLQEEKKKLTREKAALENRMRDSQEKAQQSKLERQEMHILKQELEQLKEEMHIKESRWNAAQSRHKCQMRILKMENSKLKQEVERLQNLKKSGIRNKEKPGTSSNTRAIHQINKQINMQFKESQKINDVLSQVDQKLIEAAIKTTGIDSQNIDEEREHNYNNNKGVTNEKSQTTIENVARKRNLYENLIKEVASDLAEIEGQFNTSKNLNESNSDLNSKFKQLESKTNIIKDGCEKSYEGCDIFFNHDNSNIQVHVQNDHTHFVSPTKTYHEDHEKNLTLKSYDESSSTHVGSTSLSCQSKISIDKQGIKQIQHNDGSIEYHFPNGNIKKVFPDQGLTKLIYYNGDVRETNKNGEIKYFYASTRTWHTTMPDGLEILKFADGQIERRLHNGAVEVSFPDGSVRILESNGIEKWTLPDGTLIQILTNGEKILILPNGQREVHTKMHKRREYPDGTIKLIYLDGTQETRYSNGRIRVKDKDGNLLMDSHQ